MPEGVSSNGGPENLSIDSGKSTMDPIEHVRQSLDELDDAFVRLVGGEQKPTLLSIPQKDSSPESGPEEKILFIQDDTVMKAAEELLALLPGDILTEIKEGKIDLRDPAFIEGLVDHFGRQKIPKEIASKIMSLQKKMRAQVRRETPDKLPDTTIRSERQGIGRNDRCSCGSGKKYKQCCLRKKRSN